MSPQQQPARPESPPYVTSDMHQSMEAYQENFWQRQMARVEEQVSLPDDQMAAVASVQQSASSIAGPSSSSGEGQNEKDAAAAAAAAAAFNPHHSMSDADMAASAKSLMELFKPQAGQLPLARIKKVMKASDDEVKMISAEAPILFARACEIFIADLTCRSYMHATSNRRRTVQQSDVVAAVAGSNVFDFLVDIIPRGAEGGAGGTTTTTTTTTTTGSGDPLQQDEVTDSATAEGVDQFNDEANGEAEFISR